MNHREIHVLWEQFQAAKKERLAYPHQDYSLFLLISIEHERWRIHHRALVHYVASGRPELHHAKILPRSAELHTSSQPISQSL
jgi:hypothetical protein